MLHNGVISPSVSPWAAPVVFVRKSDGTMRFCVGYRKLNTITRKDSHPLPRLSEALDALGGARWFSTLDLHSGYWQMRWLRTQKKKRHLLHTMACISLTFYRLGSVIVLLLFKGL